MTATEGTEGGTPAETLETLRRSRAIAVLRSHTAAHFAAVADVLVAAGIRVVEFTLTTPGALAALAEYAPSAPAQAWLGVGTVLTPADVAGAVDAGARYVVTPTFSDEVVASASELGVPVLVGALTPSEIYEAHRAGAAAVKVFPAALGGPRYLRLVRDPLPDIPLVPTGGVRIDAAADYIAAGAIAVGLGGALTGDSCAGGDLGALRERAEALAEAVGYAAV